MGSDKMGDGHEQLDGCVNSTVANKTDETRGFAMDGRGLDGTS